MEKESIKEKLAARYEEIKNSSNPKAKEYDTQISELFHFISAIAPDTKVSEAMVMITEAIHDKVTLTEQEAALIREHKNNCQQIREASIVESWREGGYLCIRYSSGDWYHYNAADNEWW